MSPELAAAGSAGLTASRAAPLLAALLLLALSPYLAVEIPAMVDYPNHLARMSVLARAGGPLAHPDYEVVWALSPNLAMDLLVPPLSRLVGVETAARAFLIVSLVLLATGAVAIEVAQKGRVELSGYAALLSLYAMPFAWGFLNFAFGLGLALWCIAGSILTRRRSPLARIAVHAGAIPLLYASHLFALGLFGFAVGLIELWRVASGRASWRHAAAIGLAMAAPTLLLLAATQLQGGEVGGQGSLWGLSLKLNWLFALNGFSFPVTFGATALLAVAAYAAARHGFLKLTGPGPILAAGFALLYLVTPFRLFDTAFADVRVSVAAMLILPAFLTLGLPSRAMQVGASALVAMLLALNVAVAWRVQAEYRTEYAGLIDSFGLLERNARVLVGHTGKALDPPLDLSEYPIHHAPTLAAHSIDAFVPTLFAHPGKQPLRPRAHLRHLAATDSGPEPLANLLRAASGTADPSGAPHLSGWTREFDALYLVGSPGPNPLPERLQELRSGGRWTLYRILR